MISLIVSGFTLCVSPDNALDTVLLDIPSSLAISIIVVCFISFVEQWIQMGQASKILHGRKQRVSSVYYTYTQLSVNSSWRGLTLRRSAQKQTVTSKAFFFRFVSVSDKWIKTPRRYVLNVHTETMQHEGDRVTSVGSVSFIPAVPVDTLSHEAVDVPHIRVVEHL